MQWDLSSSIKEYVNRVGRTARIASQGQSICFVQSTELEYVKYLKDKYKIDLKSKNRFILASLFQAKLIENAKAKKKDPLIVSFRKLKAIDDKDE